MNAASPPCLDPQPHLFLPCLATGACPSLPPGYRQVRMVFATLERHFPERLRAIYLLDASWVFHGAWHLIEPFIDA